MIYFTIDEKLGKYIEYNDKTDTVRVFIKSDLEKQNEDAQARLAEIPPAPTDKVLLEWARANYPIMNYANEKANLEKVISEGEATLASIK